MILKFSQECLSITEFNPVELPDVTVLTGINGSGKSQLLQAITEKKVIIAGLETATIVKFNYETFRLENEGAFNAQQITSERNEAWNFFVNQQKVNIASWKNVIGDEYQELVQICINNEKPLWYLSAEDIGNTNNNLYERLNNYKTNIKVYFDQSGIKNNQQAQGILALIKKLPYSIDDITQSDFLTLYKPYYFKEDFLPQQLGKIIWDYYVKFRTNQVNEFQNEKHGTTYPYILETEFIKLYGDRPWEVINKILEKFNTLNYKATSPEGLDYFGNFQLKLLHTKKPDLEIGFENLSSGERILMALVASIYKSTSDNHFPDILLLDEIDASLHPSMMQNLLEVIRDIFLVKGVKVILVTHSPSTIALAPEESVFVMNKEGINRIEKKKRADALQILTEGFATLEEGIKIFDQISKSNVAVITEGRNTSFIKKAIELEGLTDIEVISGVEGHSGKEQLKTLFEFLTRIPHEKQIVFVWDCDAQYNLSPTNNTIPFVFKANPNNLIAKRGIENIFDQELFNDFKKVIILSNNSKIIEFDETRKKDFEAFILARGKKEEFIGFEPLIQQLREILSQLSRTR
jgi:predicted ATPase